MDRRRHDAHRCSCGHRVPPERRGEGSGGVAEAHVDGWRHLPPQGRQIPCGGLSGKGRAHGDHGDVVAILELHGGVRGGRRPGREHRIQTLHSKTYEVMFSSVFVY